MRVSSSWRPVGSRCGRDHLDLPVLEVDGGPSAEEMNYGDELVALAAADHGADQAAQGAAFDPDEAADGNGGLGHDGQARGEHLVDLAEVAAQGFLIGNVEHVDQPVPLEGLDPVAFVAEQEQVAGE